jgi:hypothetical protein
MALRRSRTWCATALLLASPAFVAEAQSSVQLDGRLLRTGIDTFQVSYAGRLLGVGIMDRSRVGRETVAQLLQVYTWRGGRGDWTIDSLFAEERSLRTAREVRVSGDTTIVILYTSTGIEVVTQAGNSPVTRKFVAAAPFTYSSAALEGLVAASPLSPNYSREYVFFYAPPSARGMVRIKLHVIGSERVTDQRGRTREAWIVAADTPNGGTSYWIDRETRAVLKYDTHEGPAVIEFRR